MSIGDIAVGLVAFIALALLALIVLNKLIALIRNWRDVAWASGVAAIIVGSGALAILLLGTVVGGGILAYGYLNDRNMMQKCSTAYERREKAHAAPDDYFGRRLREEATAEAKQCAEFAAHKEAAKGSEK